MSEFINVFNNRSGELWRALGEHIQISFIALLFAVMIAVPLAVYLTRHEKAAEVVIGIASVIQTIPSLALLGILIPILGIGKFPAIVALVAYALLPILRNTYTGITEIDSSLIEAAQAMGMNPRKRLTKVEIPLALPVIMAGIRTAMVLIVGTTTLAALIGGGGLGDLILLGIDRNNMSLILLGAIPAALLALFFDFLLKQFQRFSYKKAVFSIVGIGVVAIGLLVAPLFGTPNKTLVIGAKLGAEPEILINMYKILIEEETDWTVELEPGLGKTSFVFNALRTNSIDIYPEFTGTAISEFLKETAVSNDEGEVYQQAKVGLEDQFDLIYLEPMQFNNTYTLSVEKSFGEKYGLETISDLKSVVGDVKAGFTREFADREDGYLGIQSLYGIQFDDLVTMEPKLRYSAIENGEINLMDAYSTDSELRQYGLKVLEDDQKLFPPYQGAPLMRKETAEDNPDVVEALNKLVGQITDREMREMNYQVNVEGVDPGDAAESYLKEAKIIE